MTSDRDQEIERWQMSPSGYVAARRREEEERTAEQWQADWSNYFGINGPEVISQKRGLYEALLEEARRARLYDTSGGWHRADLEQLAHEMHWNGFRAGDDGAIHAALIGIDGVGCGVAAANRYADDA